MINMGAHESPIVRRFYHKEEDAHFPENYDCVGDGLEEPDFPRFNVLMVWRGSVRRRWKGLLLHAFWRRCY